MIEISALEKWITWTWDDGWKGLDEASEDHVWGLMKEGYTEGELNRLDDKDEEIRGWWKKL